MNCWIALGFAPASISSEAKVWRHSCSVIGLSELRLPPAACSSRSRSFATLPGALRPVVDGRRVEGFLGRAAEDKVLASTAGPSPGCPPGSRGGSRAAASSDDRPGTSARSRPPPGPSHAQRRSRSPRGRCRRREAPGARPAAVRHRRRSPRPADPRARAASSCHRFLGRGDPLRTLGAPARQVDPLGRVVGQLVAVDVPPEERLDRVEHVAHGPADSPDASRSSAKS